MSTPLLPDPYKPLKQMSFKRHPVFLEENF